jgi:hypothetical protein
MTKYYSELKRKAVPVVGDPITTKLTEALKKTMGAMGKMILNGIYVARKTKDSRQDLWNLIIFCGSETKKAMDRIEVNDWVNTLNSAYQSGIETYFPDIKEATPIGDLATSYPWLSIAGNKDYLVTKETDNSPNKDKNPEAFMQAHNQKQQNTQAPAQAPATPQAPTASKKKASMDNSAMLYLMRVTGK